jgi:hypothetical protein
MKANYEALRVGKSLKRDKNASMKTELRFESEAKRGGDKKGSGDSRRLSHRLKRLFNII